MTWLQLAPKFALTIDLGTTFAVPRASKQQPGLFGEQQGTQPDVAHGRFCALLDEFDQVRVHQGFRTGIDESP